MIPGLWLQLPIKVPVDEQPNLGCEHCFIGLVGREYHHFLVIPLAVLDSKPHCAVIALRQSQAVAVHLIRVRALVAHQQVDVVPPLQTHGAEHVAYRVKRPHPGRQRRSLFTWRCRAATPAFGPVVVGVVKLVFHLRKDNEQGEVDRRRPLGSPPVELPHQRRRLHEEKRLERVLRQARARKPEPVASAGVVLGQERRGGHEHGHLLTTSQQPQLGPDFFGFGVPEAK
mmetsp:Transcript_2795/g.5647  ORF Transcript_2795/g.5647 Transcript_2795/m.5647 type:complete len:228 (+) Transcript_2795:185-868(+)